MNTKPGTQIGPELRCTDHPCGRGIADAIKMQIGTDAWLAVSARNPRWWTNSNGDVVFAFRYGNRYGCPCWCEITYQDASDDYDVRTIKVRRNGHVDVLSEQDGVYASSLGEVIREANAAW
jgi:hypothetical protein